MQSHSRLAGVLVVVLAPVLLVGVALAGAQNKYAKVALQFTRQAEFAIPFGFDGASSGKGKTKPVEVQLFVSSDAGKTWQLHSKVKPRDAGFHFHAPRDGEYWFMVRTKDSLAQLRPHGPASPELKVVVDTTKPNLEISAQRGEAGEIRLDWKIVELNLESDAFKVSYQLAGDRDQWQPIAVEPLVPGDADGTCDGATTFVPLAEGDLAVGDSARIRAEVVDRAGNRSVIERSLTESDPRVPAGKSGDNDHLAAESIASPERVPADAQPAESAELAPNSAIDETFDPPAMPQLFPTAVRPNTLVHGRGQPDQKESKTKIEGRYVSTGGEPAEDDDQANVFKGELLPPGARPLVVNSKRFEIEYEIQTVAPQGVAKVELWGTRDGGRTWSSFGVDPDHQSPMPASVDEPGLYGFRVLIETGSGLRSAAPSEGDAPDVWIGVDLTKPDARLISAEQGSGEAANLVIIQWEAQDEQLAARPISLSFAPAPGGPWTPIATGLENTGRFEWQFDHRVPDQVFLRLDVADEAGNSRAVEPADGVFIRRARPQGRIRQVRPVDQSARRPKVIQNPY